MTKSAPIISSTGLVVWPYEEQTRRKHEIVRRYFDCWIKILGKWSSLNCFDCFGGGGAYGDPEHPSYGSPILEAQCIDANRERLNRDVHLIVIEKNHSNIENMKRAFDQAATKTQPIYVENDFDRAINDILDRVDLTPSFFFIDPFGFSIRYATLERIMRVPKSEMFINFMFNAVNRFLSAHAVEENMTALYGTDEWRPIVNLGGEIRERALCDLYRTQLKGLGRFVYGYPMSFEKRRRTYYYLFHVTNNSKGCTIMKSVVAKACDGYLGYRGPNQYEPTLFDTPALRITHAKTFLIEHFTGKTLTYGQLVEQLADSTPYLESELRASVKGLEPVSVIVNRSPTSPGGRRRNGLCEQDVLSFPQEAQ
jgi:three-Cys-motif partner protein